MALLKCKECGHDVADTAKACPNCGAKPQQQGLSGCMIILLVIACILVVLGVVGAATDEKKAPTPPNKMAAFACGEFIKKHLRDPNSLEFVTDPLDATASQLEDGSFVAALTARANNGFGGKTVSTFTCTVDNSSGDWHLQHLAEIGGAGGVTVVFDDGSKH